MSSEQLAQELLALPIEERVALAEALWQSIDGPALDMTNEAKLAIELAQRRDADLTFGGALGRTHEQVMEAARRALKCG